MSINSFVFGDGCGSDGIHCMYYDFSEMNEPLSTDQIDYVVTDYIKNDAEGKRNNLKWRSCDDEDLDDKQAKIDEDEKDLIDELADELINIHAKHAQLFNCWMESRAEKEASNQN